MKPARKHGGGWPKGRRRNASRAVTHREVHTVMGEVASLVRDPVPDVCSRKVLARYCGVSDRTVRRWLDGTDWPDAVTLRRIRSWVRTQQAA